jgi:acyl-CoA synthetase (AMP-forming)/AMP-acid ligase II
MKLDKVFQDVLKRDPDEPAIEENHVWYPRRRLTAVAQEIGKILAAGGIASGAPVGLVARNRLLHLGALFGLLAGRYATVMMHAYQAPAKLAAEVADLRLPVLVADSEDWANADLVAAARKAGTIGIAISRDEANPVRLVAGLEKLGPGPHHTAGPDVAMEILTSGTTGAPKRVAMTYRTFEQSMADAALAVQHSGATADRPEPYVQYFPLGNISGVYGLLLCAGAGRGVILMEKFNVADWARAVKTYKLTSFVSLPPAGIRMVLEANVPKEDLASVPALRCGSAPLRPEMQDEFESRYGIPILVQYGATEFCGVIANWTVEDHRAFAKAKRGSVGRARPGIQIRIIDPGTGAELPRGEVGQLEVLVPRLYDHWIRTTDLGLVDGDGFVFLRGRADSVIIRGGFKLVPDAIADVLRLHPSVKDAAVVGIADARLGEVPVGAVELHPGAAAPQAGELESAVRNALSPQHVPVRIDVMAALPRTGSLKVDRGTLKKQMEAAHG